MRELITNMSIFESSRFSEDSNSSRKGVLRTIKGPLAEWDNLNRNGRKYSERLWDKVIESPYVKEQMKFKTLLGEANHPEGRLEVDFERVSHSIVEMYKGNDKTIYGTIDILDTPLGRILNVLYEYGSTLGISSRAGGVLHQRKGFNEVDEDSYHFVTFDIVPFPSVSKARLVSEGVSVVDSDRIEISDKAHNDIISIIESSSQKDKNILKDFIYKLDGYNLDREISMLEGVNMNEVSQESNKNLMDTTLCLLKESYSVSAKLREENTTLFTKVQELSEKLLDIEKTNKSTTQVSEGLKSDLIKVANERSKYKSKVSGLEEELKGLRNTISMNEGKLLDKELENYEVKELVESNKNVRLLAGKLKQDNSYLVSENTRLNKIISEKDEIIVSLDGKYKKLEESCKSHNDYDDLVSEVVSLVKELDSVNKVCEGLIVDAERCSSVERELEDTKNQVGVLESKLLKVSKDMENINESVGQKDFDIQVIRGGYENQIETLKENILCIEEGYISKLNSYKKDLVVTICSNYNVDSKRVMESLGDKFTVGDIHLICESLINKNSSPIIYKAVDNSSSVDTRQKTRLDNMFTQSRRG